MDVGFSSNFVDQKVVVRTVNVDETQLNEKFYISEKMQMYLNYLIKTFNLLSPFCSIFTDYFFRKIYLTSFIWLSWFYQLSREVNFDTSRH